ncbi:MAG: alpha/beta hydrolase [Brucellaceae bacterium]|nr:alpha/beta hydrolase [Brucellaceae bacterium]
MTKAVAEKAMDYGIHRFLADGVHYRDWADIRAAMPSWEEWPQTWAKWAADTEERADAELAKGSTLTAAADYARAALYYHTGQYLLFDDLELKKRIHDSKIAAFSKGLEHFATPIERVEIPFKNITMPGYFRVPAGVDNPPCVVLLGGLDTTKEDYLVVSDMLIARGIATIGFDGPGQGETFFKMALEQDFEKSVSAVIDYVEKRPEIDKNRIGLVGRSLGGYWGPKTAATDDRVKALVCWGVIYDYENFDNIKTAHYSTYVGLKAVTGLDDEAARDFYLAFDLTPYASKINCPTLLCHGGLDVVTPIVNVTKILKDLTCPVEQLVWEDSGHCCHDRSHIQRPGMADFFQRHLV